MSELDNTWRKPNNEELRQCQIGILSEVHRFCEEHGIRYFLDYGTLLGCIRHKGYIPWDDDIDICMLKEDYDRFISLFPHNEGKYRVHDVAIDKDFPYYYAKVSDSDTVMFELIDGVKVDSGINIDLFALEKRPCTPLKRFKAEFLRRYYNALLLPKTVLPDAGRSAWKKAVLSFLGLCTKHMPAQKICARFRNAMEALNEEKSDALWNCMFGDIRSVEQYQSRLTKEFEGRLYYIPSDFDGVLTCLYGDYMQPPPVEQRISTHDFDAYIR